MRASGDARGLGGHWWCRVWGRTGSPATERDTVGTSGLLHVGGRVSAKGARSLRECFQMTLTERHRAKMESDELVEIRAWKLFALVHVASQTARDWSCWQEWIFFPSGGVRQGTLEGVDWSSLAGFTSTIWGFVQNAATQRRGNAAGRQLKQGWQVLRWHPRTKPLCKNYAHADRRSRCSRFPRKFWITCRLPKWIWMRSCSPHVWGKRHQVRRQDQEVAPTRCWRCVWTTPKQLHLLTSAAEDFARSSIPNCIYKAFTTTMTALQKPDGGIRGIATSTSMCSCVTWTWQSTAGWTAGVWRLWRTVSLSLVVSSLP